MCLIPRIAIIAPSTRICQCFQGFFFIFGVRGIQMLPHSNALHSANAEPHSAPLHLWFQLFSSHCSGCHHWESAQQSNRALRLCDHVISCFLLCNQHKGAWWHSLLPNSAPLLAWSMMLQTNCKTAEIKYLNANSQKL